MAFLQNPIDIEQYIRVYRREKEMGTGKKLVAFTQTKAGKYRAHWQDDAFANELWGDCAKLQKWLDDKEAAYDEELRKLEAETDG